MPLLDQTHLEDILGRYSGDVSVRLAVRVGSQVYGTATPESDTDFVVVGLGDKDSDLLFGHDYNVTLMSQSKFISALQEPSIFAWEALNAPPEHRLIDKGDTYGWPLDTADLSHAAHSKSESDWKKGLKLIGHESDKARKKLWHSVRIPLFALQMKQAGGIFDFTEANDLYEEILTEPSEDPFTYEKWLGPIRSDLLASLVG